MWGELSRTHRVYAVDTVGEAGRSVGKGRPVDDLAGFMDWLDGLRLSYRLRAVPVLLRPGPARMRAFLEWETAGSGVDPAWLTLICLGREFPSARIVLARRPAPDRLRALTVPTLLLLAERKAFLS